MKESLFVMHLNSNEYVMYFSNYIKFICSKNILLEPIHLASKNTINRYPNICNTIIMNLNKNDSLLINSKTLIKRSL